MFSIGANVVSPITNNASIIHITCSYGSQPAEGFYNFNNHTQYEENARTLISELKRRGIRSISLFSQNNIGSVEQTEVLVDMLNRDGTISILANETFNPGVRDFTMIIHRALRSGKPDIFYFNGMNPDTLIFAKNLWEITGELNLTTINDFTKYPDKTPFNDLWFVESAYGTECFVGRFKKVNNGDDPLTCGANMYDNLDMLIWAFENTSLRPGEVIPHNDDVVKTIHSIQNWQGAIGNISVDEAGIIQSEASIKMIRDGRVVFGE
jgi:ABC-type branched-subunit amino acid transport system substrate-binding protein